MYTRNHSFRTSLKLVCFALLALSAANRVNAADGHGDLGLHLAPALGKTPSLHNDNIISPDGQALPNGSGSAVEGEALYIAACASCHGIGGEQPGNAIVGGKGSIGTDKPFRTVGSYWPHATTLYDYIARAMPYDKQKSLTADETYAITAYVLELNQIIGKNEVMDKHTLPAVKMPNANGFIELE